MTQKIFNNEQVKPGSQDYSLYLLHWHQQQTYSSPWNIFTGPLPGVFYFVCTISYPLIRQWIRKGQILSLILTTGNREKHFLKLSWCKRPDSCLLIQETWSNIIIYLEYMYSKSKYTQVLAVIWCTPTPQLIFKSGFGWVDTAVV